jgi:hypothetical protein
MSVILIYSGIFRFCPEFWWRDMFIYFVFSSNTLLKTNLLGPFANFLDSPYYSESELCGGAVTASFSKYLPYQAMHLLQRSTHFSEMCSIRWSLRSSLPRSSLFMVGKAQKWHGRCPNGVPPIYFFQAEHRIQFRSRPKVGGALWEVHRLLKEVLRKRDHHRTSTKFRLGVIRWVHEICKRPAYKMLILGN